MELFYGKMSGNSSRAVFGLNEIGAPYDARLVDTSKGENKSADYLALNPMGKIPALRDGSLSLWESNAINFYAAEKHNCHKLLGTNRAAVLRWCFFQSAHVSPACINIFRYTNAQVKAFWKTEGDAQAAAASEKELPRYLAVLDAALQNSDWLEGDFSLADIAYASHFDLIKSGGFNFAAWPRLSAWLDRLLARPAWLAARQRVVGS